MPKVSDRTSYPDRAKTSGDYLIGTRGDTEATVTFDVDDFQSSDATLTSIAALGTAADRVAYTTGVDTWAETVLTTFGRSLIDDADAATARGTLGLGTAATQAATDFVAVGGDTMNGNLDFGDNVQARFGASQDLAIGHNGSQSYIIDSGTGNLAIQTSSLQVQNAAGTETLAGFTENGAATLYYDNAAKIATTTSGIAVTGGATFTEALQFTTPTAYSPIEVTSSNTDVNLLRVSDNGNDTADYGYTLKYMGTRTGNDNDLSLFVDNQLGTQLEAVQFHQDGTVDYNYEVTFNGGASFLDNDIATFGTSDDLQIYHSGSHSFISEQGTGSLVTLASQVSIKNPANTETMATFAENGAVTLYYDNAVSVQTGNGYVDLNGDIYVCDTANNTAQIVISNTGTYSAGTQYEKGTISSSTLRWWSGMTNDAESTGDAGSNFHIERYSDAGAYLGAPIVIERSSGDITMETALHLTNGSYRQHLTIARSGQPTYDITPTTGSGDLQVVRGGTTAAQFEEAGTSLDDNQSVVTREKGDARYRHFIATADISAAATSDWTAFDSTEYDAYEFVLMNVVPATDNVELLIRTSTDGGTGYDSSAGNYKWQHGQRTDSSEVSYGSTSDTKIQTFLAVGSDTGEDGVSGSVWVYGPHLAKQTHITWNLSGKNINGFRNCVGSGIRDSAADVDAIRFLFDSGNIESGTITMYGYRNG